MKSHPEKPSFFDENSIDHQRLRNLIRHINTLILEGDYLSEKPADQMDKLLYLVYNSRVGPKVADGIKDYFSKKAESPSDRGVFFISDEKLNEFMELCEDEKEKQGLREVVIYLNRLGQRKVDLEEGGKEMQKRDILALVEVDFFHWRVANFFRIKLSRFLREPFKGADVKKELREYWESCQQKVIERKKIPRPSREKAHLDIGPEETEDDGSEGNIHVVSPEMRALIDQDKLLSEKEKGKRLSDKNTDNNKIEEVTDRFEQLEILKKEQGGEYIFNCRKPDGKLVSDEWLTGIRWNEMGINVILKNGKHNILNLKGEFLLEENCNWASCFHEGRAKILMGTKWYFICEDGSFLLSEIAEKVEGAKVASMSMRFPRLAFERACNFENGFAKVEENGESFLIDRNGQRHELTKEDEISQRGVKILPSPPWMVNNKKEEEGSSVFDSPPSSIGLPDSENQTIPLAGSLDKKDNARGQITPFDELNADGVKKTEVTTFPIPIPVPTEEAQKNHIKAARLKQWEILKSAQDYYKKGDYDIALSFYQSALKVSTDGHAKIFQRISACYFRIGELDNAIKSLEKAIKRKPENEKAIFTLIYKFLVQKHDSDLNGLIEAFEEVLRKNNQPLEELEGEIKKEVEKSRLQLEIRGLHGTFALAMNRKMNYQLIQDLNQAFKRYKELIIENPEGDFQHRELACKLRKLNELSKISTEAVFFAHEQDMSRYPGSYQAIAELGRTYFTFGTYHSLMKASGYLIEALSMNPDPTGSYEWIRDMVLKEIPKKIAELRKKGLIPPKK